MQTEPRTLLLSHQQLIPDPDNPRRFYPAEDVAAMAESIRDGGGVEVPLLVQTRPDLGSMYQVIDGHFRLAGAEALGPDAPPLRCEVRSGLSRRDTLLIMARTSALWFAKDPISEAKHYRKLLDGVGPDPGMTMTALARAIGHSTNFLSSRLRLLDLDPEIQEHVAVGALSKDPHLVDALLSITDRSARIKLAAELAKRKASVRAVQLACERLRANLRPRPFPRSDGTAMPRSLEIAARSGPLPSADASGLPAEIRSAAAAACGACDIRQEILAHVPEPAWALVSHVAGETCGNCSLAAMHTACGGCPLPEFLMRLSKAAIAPAPPAALVIQGGNGRPQKGTKS